MRVESLTSLPDGTIAAVIVTANGVRIEVGFSTAQQGGITVANPDSPIFEREDLDAASVRELIAAVIAFDRVATRPGGPEGA
ncbi:MULTISPECIES: hypothetical protein [unclassified Nocardioides]|uniref:hypothetical protein n=1 Tax=unclassified Nocardioides TaxID=2615069 RepID=UPI0006FFDB42|nr:MULTISPECIES: hypothetical protein [unclassified Nocardioides]KRA39098.1 hypothetical protein ASD81_11155 [Nocardioides sp. Root614]KRA93057.1 hypothetical protein ASD84_11420 [Nocardioides sp. Root682]